MGHGRSQRRRTGWVAIHGAAALILAGCPGGPIAPTPGASPSAPSATTPSAVPSASSPSDQPLLPVAEMRNAITGRVFNADGQRLDGATVTGRVLGTGTFANGSNVMTVTTQNGNYALTGAPAGQTVLVTATKNGYAPRQQSLVPVVNDLGDAAVNRVDFGAEAGGSGDPTYALAAGVEVVRTSPAAAATGVDPETTFTLTFSGPVVATDVEQAFCLYVAGPLSSAGVYGGAADRYTLTAQDSSGSPIGLSYGYDTTMDDGSAGRTAAQVMPDIGLHRLFDATAFSAEWTNGQTVVFRFKHGYRLPSDRDAARLPTYAMTLEGKTVRATAGGVEAPARFRLSATQPGRYGATFKVGADTTPPRLVGVTGLNRADTGGTTPLDRIRVTYSEPMHLIPLTLGGLAIPGVGASTSATWMSHYAYAVKDRLDGDLADPDLKSPVGGVTATLDTTDATHRAVLFAPDTDEPAASGSRGFSSGQTLWVRVGSGVTDPAGNAMDPALGSALRSGRAI